MKMKLTLAAAALLGGLTLGAGAASATPLGPNVLQAGSSDVTQVRMMRSDRMMMKKRMMQKKMMRRQMMRKRMMHRM